MTIPKKRKLPSYNISGILQLRNKIADDLGIINHIGTQPVREDFDYFVDVIANLMPARIARELLWQSCEYLMGELLTPESIAELAWRLAGNVRRLRNGHPVLPWAGIPVKEWMPVQIMQADYDVSRRGKVGAHFTFQILAGRAAPMQVMKFWTQGYCHILAPRMGFTKYARSKYPFQDTSEFVNLRLMLAVEPGEAEVVFEEVAATSSAKEWNQKYIRMRARTLPGFKCPRKLRDDKTCFRCYYGQDKCPAAVRPDTLTQLLCRQCERQKFHDPAHREVCIDCHRKNIRKERRDDQNQG